MIRLYRKKQVITSFSRVVSTALLFQCFAPLQTLALTSGPSTPEVQSFEPIGTTQMVDPFTGDFNYNIPLMDVGGYPLNLAYHAGIEMEQEASWVGLGWNINPGVINRNVRGIADDFKGDEINYELNIKPNRVTSLSVSSPLENLEVFGFKVKDKYESKNINLGIVFNNYKGVGVQWTYDNMIGVSSSNGLNFSKSAILNTNFIEMEGWTELSKDVLRKKEYFTEKANTISVGYNSRHGLQNVNFARTQRNLKTGTTKSVAEISKSFAINYYTPISNPRLSSISSSAEFTTGPEFLGTFPGSSFSIGMSEFYLKEKDQSYSRKAYGYLNAEFSDDASVMDKNQSYIGFNRFTNYLPHSTHTYDNFSIAGQGIGGNFRAFRTQIGAIADPSYATDNKFSSNGFGLSGNIEFGAGNVTKVGYDIKPSLSLFSEGRWKICKGCENKSIENLRYLTSRGGFDETYYFKDGGEFNIVDNDYLTAFKGEKTVKLSIKDIEILPSMSPSMVYDWINGSTPKYTDDEISISQPIRKSASSREKRKNVIQTLSGKQRNKYGIDRQIFDYSNGKNQVNHNYRKDHHISEITSIAQDGSRYVYGLAAYNTTQKDVSFAIGETGLQFDPHDDGLVTYDANCPTKSNDKGIDHYYQSTQTPAYAYAYHLTCILSPDYADLTGDGPTPDDFGSYTKFNYQKLSSNMDWRVPSYKAIHQRGLKSNPYDDRANYSYGQKEIWYLKSIETKTHVAIFDLSDREDGLGTIGENKDGIQRDAFNVTLKLKKLDRIRLYTRKQITDFSNFTVSNNEIPVKVVNFEYSYDLCSNVPNNSKINLGVIHPLYPYLSSGVSSGYNWDQNQKKGKLTLHKIWFTYGYSTKGVLNPYLFEYKNNADYKYNRSDRWGVYKPILDNSRAFVYDQYNGVDDNPYTDQTDRTQADLNASMWNLTDIHLPSGGIMHINYESDDYAFVQNLPAQQMTLIKGFSLKGVNGVYSDPSDQFLNIESAGNMDMFAVVDINDSKNQLDYLSADEKYLGFKMLVALKSGIKEYISGYAQIDMNKTLVRTVGNGDKQLFICIKPVEIQYLSKKYFNPVKFRAMEFIRQNMAYLLHAGEDLMNSPQADWEKVLSVLFGSIGDATQMVGGVYYYLSDVKKLAGSVDLGYSYVRLQNPDGKKIGGGHRVKSIVLEDNWNVMSGEENHSYGQIFDYQQDGRSTGVASYEPLIGGEEIPQRQPQERIEKVPLGTNYHLTDELPVCEDMFPGPVVGYSKVKVRDLKPSDLQLIDPSTNQYYQTDKHSNGYKEYQFYTAFDFPTRAQATVLDKQIYTSLTPQYFGINITKAIATQGYSVEVNNMHGQPRVISSYDNNGKIVTRTEYVFKHEGNKLINDITVLRKDGTVANATGGVSIETVVEPLESEKIDVTAGIQTNFDGFVMGLIPAPAWSVLPNWNYNHSQVKTAVVTKLIQKYGVLEKIIINKNGSTLETKNLAWDAETGDVLLSATQTMFGDYDYNLTLPAHFAYSGMDGSYLNLNATFTSGCNSGVVSFTEDNLLTPGDELQVIKQDGTFGDKAWVLDVNSSNNTASLIDDFGAIYPNGTYDFMVIRSGHRNLQNAPISQISMINNPIVNGRFDSYSGVNMNSIIASSAIEYHDLKSVYSIPEISSIKKCDGNLNNTNISYHVSDVSQDITYYNYSDANLGGIVNPSNRFMPCLNQTIPCSVNYVNPYLLGIKGCYFPYKSFTYYDKLNPERSTSVNLASQNPDYNTSSSRYDGLISGFMSYWNAVTSGYWTHLDIDQNNDNINDKWTWSNKSDLIDQNGNELQSSNALGISSSALYGYDKNFAVAVAQNAKYNQILFDGFEEYSTLPLYTCPPALYAATVTFNQYNTSSWHWQLWPNLSNGRASIINYESHSGKQSLEIGHGVLEIPFSLPKEPNYPTSGGLLSRYHLNKQNTIGGFYPDCYNNSGESVYLLTYWAKYNKRKVTPIFNLQYHDGTNWVSINFEDKEEIIWVDGWARKTLRIAIPLVAQGKPFRIQLAKGIYNTGTLNINSQPTLTQLNDLQNMILIDDVRIMPELSNMKSFVYDNYNYRLMAVLDENHFATFYEYDDEGNLLRTKKETEKGIITIQEARQNIRKRP